MSLPRSTAKAVAIGGIALSTIAVGVVAANAAPTALPVLTAATDDTEVADDPSSSDSDSPRHGPRGMRGGHGPELADLAERLGVEEAALEDAMSSLRETRREEGRSAMAAALAEELGIDEETVTAAFEELHTERRADARAALEERLGAAVEEGTLTEADQESVLKAFDAGLLGRGPGGRG
jgi:transcriptional regulator with XRE-family HTH domain